MFYLVNKSKDLAQDIASQLLRDCSEEGREEPGYIDVYAPKTQWLLLIEEYISHVKEFSTFPCLGKRKSLSSPQSLLWQTRTSAARASTLCSLTLSLLGGTTWDEAATECWVVDLLCLHSEFPGGRGLCVRVWWLQHSLFADRVGGIFNSQ